MLDRQHGKIQFCCDVCGDVLDTDTRDFTEARTIMGREGWKARKFGNDWVHSCTGCGDPGERAPLAKNGRLFDDR